MCVLLMPMDSITSKRPNLVKVKLRLPRIATFCWCVRQDSCCGVNLSTKTAEMQLYTDCSTAYSIFSFNPLNNPGRQVLPPPHGWGREGSFALGHRVHCWSNGIWTHMFSLLILSSCHQVRCILGDLRPKSLTSGIFFFFVFSFLAFKSFNFVLVYMAICIDFRRVSD